MKQYLLLTILIISTNKILLSQKKSTDDVVYLKNQWVLRGQIISDDSIKISIRTFDGNIFVFRRSEIENIAKEKKWSGYHYREKGFVHYTELGPLVAGKTSIEGVTTAAFSFQTVNGYKFSRYAQAALGVGADLYATQTILPVFGSLRGDIIRSDGVIPFYFLDAGYGINITQNSAITSDFKGGLLYAAGVGLKIPFNRTAGFLLSLGYRYQNSSYNNDGIKTDIIYKRLAIRAGFFL
ncbi:MAG: hypothetical protein JST75_08965 [Bacteroidetes bacterium]|nr:hypothetical protein [Bacteroidota bacterium]